MAAATNQQMQEFADSRIRPHVEQIRALVAAMQSDVDAMDAIYQRFTNGPAWADSRSDGPPNLLTDQSHSKYNAFIVAALSAITGHPEYHNVLAMCVRAP